MTPFQYSHHSKDHSNRFLLKSALYRLKSSMQLSHAQDLPHEPKFKRITSLVSSFVLSISESFDDSNKNPLQQIIYCQLIPISHFQDKHNVPKSHVGTEALTALQLASNDNDYHVFLHPQYHDDTIRMKSTLIFHHSQQKDEQKETKSMTVQVDLLTMETQNETKTQNHEGYASLISFVSRILLQRHVQQFRLFQNQNHPSLDLHLTSQSAWIDLLVTFRVPIIGQDHDPTTHSQEVYRVCDILQKGGFPVLFASLLPSSSLLLLHSSYSNMEMSDIVDMTGTPIAYIPRLLLHTFNILHRGVGILVYQRKYTHLNHHDNTQENNPLDQIYVHRRTHTKRIFPSLHDMFVGGVSMTDEDLTCTATRELAEELGLHRVSALSQPHFQCIVGTLYNRCVVTVFTYEYTPEQDRIQWQEEEVAWGDFVPYERVVKAARSSIRRLQDSELWPGSVSDRGFSIPIVSPNAEKGQGKETFGIDPCSSSTQNSSAYGHSYPVPTLEPWVSWDFVPDGLLVWEAWLQWLCHV